MEEVYLRLLRRYARQDGQTLGSYDKVILFDSTLLQERRDSPQDGLNYQTDFRLLILTDFVTPSC